MLVHIYNENTGEYLSDYICQPNPLEGGFITPTFSTDIDLPVLAINEVAIFESGAWVVKPDFRGEEWFIDYDTMATVDSIGTPQGMTKQRPLATNEALKQMVKEEASTRIIALQPNWTLQNHITKQINTLSDAAILMRKEAKGTATAQETTSLDQLESLKSQIDAIATASNLVDADIGAGLITDQSGINASDKWP